MLKVHNTKSQYTYKIKTTFFPHTSTLQNTKTQSTFQLNKNTKTQNKIRTTSFPPHLMPYTPPYAFTPFLKPPNNSTLKSLKTRSTSQQSIRPAGLAVASQVLEVMATAATLKVFLGCFQASLKALLKTNSKSLRLPSALEAPLSPSQASLPASSQFLLKLL